MTLDEYKEWYREQYGVCVSEKLIESFKRSIEAKKVEQSTVDTKDKRKVR